MQLICLVILYFALLSDHPMSVLFRVLMYILSAILICIGLTLWAIKLGGLL